MTRLAENRDTHLTPAEIAEEALRQFDGGSEPSIRGLAAELRVAPSAIYHHFPSRAAVVQAAIDLVWQEATAEGFELVPDPFAEDPVEVLVSAGIATRRAWLRHHRVAPYMAATPDTNEFFANTLALLANLFERIGLEGEGAAAAFHTYASFTFGSVLFGAARLTAHEELGEDVPLAGSLHTNHGPLSEGFSTEATRKAIDEMMVVSTVDPARDEELFAQGLRRLIKSYAKTS